DGKGVRVCPPRAALAGVCEVLEAIESRARGSVLIREFACDQVVLREAMVDSDIELPVGSLAGARSEPVLIDASAGSVWLREIAHQFLCHRINQIAGSLSGRARALIGGQIVEGDERAPRDGAG